MMIRLLCWPARGKWVQLCPHTAAAPSGASSIDRGERAACTLRSGAPAGYFTRIRSPAARSRHVGVAASPSSPLLGRRLFVGMQPKVYLNRCERAVVSLQMMGRTSSRGGTNPSSSCDSPAALFGARVCAVVALGLVLLAAREYAAGHLQARPSQTRI